MTASFSRWQRAWLTLSIVLALHVTDEAAHGFLSWYNPIAASIQARLGVPFPPTFTFGVWLAGLIVMVLACLALTPLVDPRRRWMGVVATAWAVIHTGNGLLHIVGSLVAGRFTPGTWTAPLLLVAAPWLFLETRRARQTWTL